MLDILSALEQAIGLLIMAQDPTIRIFNALTNDSQQLPCVVIQAQSGDEYPLSSGNRWLSVAIRVKSSADTETQTTHKERAQTLLSILQIDDLADQLSGQLENFHIFGYRGSGFRSSIDENAFVTEFTLELYGCEVDLV